MKLKLESYIKIKGQMTSTGADIVGVSVSIALLIIAATPLIWICTH